MPKLKELPVQSKKKGNPGTKSKIKYIDCVNAFDIETTRIKEIEQSVMYIWQWHFDQLGTVIGRTWDEFTELCTSIAKELPEDVYICCHVHNLSYEFQFLRGIYKFNEDEVFCMDSRKILKCTLFQHIEMRCSFIHSNMSLSEYTRKMNAEHQKLSGAEFDYSKYRFSWTPLTDYELAYCVYDVIGLCEALKTDMQSTEDNFYTFPLTSTGYVRRDTKRVMKTVRHTYISDMFPDEELYIALREAFRGGNTHANRWYTNMTLYNVGSVDISSSYPYSETNCNMPVSRFYHKGEINFEDLLYFIDVRKKAMLLRVALHNVELKNEQWGCPYLSRDKCRQIINPVYDNGRILSADYITTTITDIDFRIIISEYNFTDIVIYDSWYSRYGKIPSILIDETIQYYKDKTRLKPDSCSPDYDLQKDLYYGKQKAKLNSIYGMMAQDPVKQDIKYIDGEYQLQPIDITKTLNSKKKNAFLVYQWGVWITAWSRYNLERGMQELWNQNTEKHPTAFIYCDTDSIKYLGNFDLSRLNAERIKSSKETGAFATDPHGKVHYMGVYEDEGRYKEFKTLGAKKYIYRDQSDRLHCTIAGVVKNKGGQELEQAGGCDAFADGFIFKEAGGTDAIYNDNPDMTYTIDGHTITITSNVVIRESTYQIGLAADYKRILEYISDERNKLDLEQMY